MMTFLVILTVVAFALLVLAAAINPVRTAISRYELERRATEGQIEAREALRRENLLSDVISLRRVAVAIFMLATVLLLSASFGWIWGTLIGLVVAVEYGAIAKTSFVQNQAKNLYDIAEPTLLEFAERHPKLFILLRSTPVETSDRYQRIDSRQELQHLIDESAGILNSDDKAMIVHGLAFEDAIVGEVMTPKSMIDTVKKDEFLGPLVLDEIHSYGHSRLPVIDGDIDHVVGVLHLNDLLSLDNKKSSTSEKIMDAKVFYIHQDESLSHALAAFIKSHRHLFIVINEYRETVGLLTLEDVVEKLIGREIVDEDDNHQDLRATALRNPRSNNKPAQHQDV